ncbi:hypothetical protein [Ferrimonas kyonanensis]|uniref:hypothetical protein n=1 Tax=Ferrimonas kyonanensis TaxID=364763 RepID=UPI000485CE4F|nr:hypothetical protein [Ferrimonas kyonanensis]
MNATPKYKINQLDDLLLLASYLTGKKQDRYASDYVRSLGSHDQLSLLSDPIHYAVEHGITTLPNGEQVKGINTTGSRIHSFGVNGSQSAVRKAPLSVLQVIADNILVYLNDAGHKRALQTLTMRRSRAGGGQGHSLACSKVNAVRFSALLKERKIADPKLTGNKLLAQMMDLLEASGK